ncbi:MAG: hypothetical protein K0R94_1272 [Burkholderiales bacterium]|jgi:hypothetical protein|nr:hypothetical protein [Burkholderiales bacterium]
MKIKRYKYYLLSLVITFCFSLNSSQAMKMDCARVGTDFKIEAMIEENIPYIEVKIFRLKEQINTNSKPTSITVTFNPETKDFEIVKLKRDKMLGQNWSLTYKTGTASKTSYIWLFTGKISKNEFKNEPFLCDYSIKLPESKYPQAVKRFALKSVKKITTDFKVKISKAPDSQEVLTESYSSINKINCYQLNGAPIVFSKVFTGTPPFIQFLIDDVINTKNKSAYIPVEIIFSQFSDGTLGITGLEGYENETSWSFLKQEETSENSSNYEMWHYTGDIFGTTVKDLFFKCAKDTKRWIPGSSDFQKIKTLLNDQNIWFRICDISMGSACTSNRKSEEKKKSDN